MSDQGDREKVNEESASRGEMGQRYLASGEYVSMRLWEHEQPGEPKPETARSYETVGYVLGGRAELRLEGEAIPLSPGDSWTVPIGAKHAYRILEPFTAVEATSPAAEAPRSRRTVGVYTRFCISRSRSAPGVRACAGDYPRPTIRGIPA